MTNVRKNSAKLTREDLKIAPESPTMELSETPAVEPSDQTSKTVRHAPLVYRVEEIAQLLAISNRAAYNLCNTTKDFKVIRLGTSIRVSKQSFDLSSGAEIRTPFVISTKTTQVNSVRDGKVSKPRRKRKTVKSRLRKNSLTAHS